MTAENKSTSESILSKAEDDKAALSSELEKLDKRRSEILEKIEVIDRRTQVQLDGVKEAQMAKGNLKSAEAEAMQKKEAATKAKMETEQLEAEARKAEEARKAAESEASIAAMRAEKTQLFSMPISDHKNEPIDSTKSPKTVHSDSVVLDDSAKSDELHPADEDEVAAIASLDTVLPKERTSISPTSCSSASALQAQTCPKCHQSVMPGDHFCIFCGAKIDVDVDMSVPKPVESSHCPKCGSPVNPDDIFCMVCGSRLKLQ